jgi:hypothetical protein
MDTERNKTAGSEDPSLYFSVYSSVLSVALW